MRNSTADYLALVISFVACAALSSPAGAQVTKLDCNPPPSDVNRDVKNSFVVAVGKILKLSGAELSNETTVVANQLLAKIPNGDRVYVAQMMMSVYCQQLAASNVTHTEKLDRLEKFNDRIAIFMSAPQQSSALTQQSQSRPFVLNQSKEDSRAKANDHVPDSSSANEPKIKKVPTKASKGAVEKSPKPFPSVTAPTTSSVSRCESAECKTWQNSAISMNTSPTVSSKFATETAADKAVQGANEAADQAKKAVASTASAIPSGYRVTPWTTPTYVEPIYTSPSYEPTYTSPSYEPTYTSPIYEPIYTPPTYTLPTYIDPVPDPRCSAAIVHYNSLRVFAENNKLQKEGIRSQTVDISDARILHFHAKKLGNLMDSEDAFDIYFLGTTYFEANKMMPLVRYAFNLVRQKCPNTIIQEYAGK